ncbi:hypothetical protein CBS101457_004011 [Exobasidium rhododendri]|nr:hypothetical protein CBS101457_004011 [Exobasidium rhododendri]
MVFQINPRTTVPLSILMIVFALYLPASKFLRPSILDVKGDPVFTNWRRANGEVFLAHRLDTAPIHYGLLHIVPAVVWSLFMPLQYWDTLRKSRPDLHRLCGYVVFSCSFILSVSGAMFIPRNLSWSEPFFHLHHVFGLPVLPTFDAFLLIFAFPLLLLTLVRALYLARNKRYAEHRRWAVYHGISGYVISIQRAWMLIVNACGHFIQQSSFLRRLLSIDEFSSMASISRAEKSAFAFTTWAAGLTCAVWFVYLYRRNLLPVAEKAKMQ